MSNYIVYLSAVCLLVMILFTTYHTIKQCKHNRNKKKANRNKNLADTSKRWYNFLHFLNYYVLLVYIVHIIFILSIELYYTLNTSYVTDENICKLKWQLLAFSVHFTKFNIYLLFMTQIYCSFMTSEYGYQLNKFIFLYIYIFIYLTVATLNDFYFINGKIINNTCYPNIPLFSMVSTLIIDLSLSILSIILFALPLYRLMKACNMGHAKLMNLIIKKCVLVFIALSSTLIVVIILFTSYIMLLQIDDMINLFCVIIIQNIHSTLYKRTCGRMCHERIAICLASTKVAEALMFQYKTLKIPKFVEVSGIADKTASTIDIDNDIKTININIESNQTNIDSKDSNSEDKLKSIHEEK
eukprot:524170_1